MLKEEQYYELDQDIIDFFKTIEKDFAFALNIDYYFQANTKQKKLIIIKKIPDNYAVMLKSTVLVTVNEDYFNKMDDDMRKILFEQELDKIQFNMDKGTLKVTQPGLKTSTGIIKKHTYESVERANETERILAEEKENE